jgi:hypothetical protein
VRPGSGCTRASRPGNQERKKGNHKEEAVNPKFFPQAAARLQPFWFANLSAEKIVVSA